MPDESLLALPPAWRAGIIKSRPGKPADGALERWRERLEQERESIEASFALPGNEPYVSHVQAYLAGEPDPLGAAAVSQLIRKFHIRESLQEETIDAWELEHGLAFTVAALIEDGGIDSSHTTVRTPGGARSRLNTREIRTASRSSVGDREYRATTRLRGSIAAAAIEDRRALREVAAERCTSAGRTTRAAVLFPDEDAWVLEACANYPSYAGVTDGGLWPLISTSDQFAAMNAPALEARSISVARCGALISGLGAGSLDALVFTFNSRRELKSGQRRTVLAGIALLPSDEAMRFLLERLDLPFVADAASAAVNRFPVRALRIAAALSKDAAGDGSLDLAAVVNEIRPELFAAAMERLAGDEQKAIEALMERPGALPVAAPGELPGLLSAPPWTTRGSDPKQATVKGQKQPVRVRHAGGWFRPRGLPQVGLKGAERALPDETVRHLSTVLATANGSHCADWIDTLSGTLDVDSLRGFGWAVFEQWIASGAPAADRWALNSLSHFGNDETVARLAPMIKEWPGQSQHQRAVAGLQVLGRIGSTTALQAMQDISRRAKFKAIKAEADRQIQRIAASLGLTREQLADRLLPDFGLGEDSTMVLDYGPRRFHVVFDEHLKPHITDDGGKHRKTLPKPGAKDDLELADAAYKRFADLKKRLRTVATDQLRRLEAAMITARTWDRDEFERYLLHHPLMRHLTRRMIWLAEAEGRRIGFRVAEDGTLSDAEDDTVDLPEGAVIRLAHPIHLSPEERGAWGRLLADYEILQPFEQMARPVLAFTDEELATGRLARFEGVTVTGGHVLGLTGRGWVRGRPMDNGTEFGCHFPLPGGGVVAIELHPGLQVGMGADVEDQQFRSVFLADSVDAYYRNSGNGHPTEIDPAVASEVLAALDRLAAKE